MHFFFACGAQNFEFLALRARNSKSQPLGAWELKILCFGPGTQDPDPTPPPPRGGLGRCYSGLSVPSTLWVSRIVPQIGTRING